MQKDFAKYGGEWFLFYKKNENPTTTKQKLKHKNSGRSRELHPGHLATKADALPLHHRVNCEYRLYSSFFTVSTQWVET